MGGGSALAACAAGLFFCFLLFFSDKVVKLICGGSVINGAYTVYFFLGISLDFTILSLKVGNFFFLP